MGMVMGLLVLMMSPDGEGGMDWLVGEVRVWLLGTCVVFWYVHDFGGHRFIKRAWELQWF